MPTLGPNTNASIDWVSAKCILIAGEDRSHWLPLLAPGRDDSFAFRGYEFRRQPGFTLVSCGIGTGCLEPLLWELLRPDIVRQVVLIGTAGKMPGSNAEVGRAYAITEAFSAGTGLDGERLPQPFKPRWPLPPSVPTTSSVSTDFFYGFSSKLLQGDYPFDCANLRAAYEHHLSVGTPLVEMEVAQFYAFCENFGTEKLKYVAIKGVSNELGDEARQVIGSASVIRRCFDVANQLMNL